MDQWIEEFLYRGRPPSGPGSETPATFHAIVGQQAESPFPGDTPSRRLIGPLTQAQLAEMGLDLTSLVDGINTETLGQLEAARAERDVLETELEAARVRITELEAK